MSTRSDGVRFVAYVYPGWHRDPFRPEVDEWTLVDRFRPYFDGHERPPRPVGGRYDDSRVETASAQVRLAAEYGIEAFTYFTYYAPDGLVMSAPMTAALRAAEGQGDFCVGATWCIRLPHASFPVNHHEEREITATAFEPPTTPDGSHALDRVPIAQTSLRDIEDLLGKAEASALRLASAGAPWLVPDELAASPSGDSRPERRRA
jgi:hypothetical protein